MTIILKFFARLSGRKRMKETFNFCLFPMQIARAFCFLHCLLLLWLIACAHCMAATSQNPAYRKVEFTSMHPAMDGFTLSFNVDEERCRTVYGKKWREKCASSIGMPGREEKNIRLEPSLAGVWRWVDGNSIHFTPVSENAIKPQSEFRLDLGEMFLPSSVILNTKKIALKTPSPAVQLVSGDFLIDPHSERATSAYRGFRFQLSRASRFRAQTQNWVRYALRPAGTCLECPKEHVECRLACPENAGSSHEDSDFSARPWTN